MLIYGRVLTGVENVLGYVSRSGWHDLVQRLQLKSLFWSTSPKAISGPLPPSRPGAKSKKPTLRKPWKYYLSIRPDLTRVFDQRLSLERILAYALILDS